MGANGPVRARLVSMAFATVPALVVLLLAEPLLRMRYVEPVPVVPPAVLEVQPWLRPDPDVGYTWQPNIAAERGIVFHNADIEYEPLSTDPFGVVNPPEAISTRDTHPPDVLGLGDSFMEMAAYEFHRAFAENGRKYYSLAVHRYAPPHYRRMLELHGPALDAPIIVVGLFENDFVETQDFDDWQESGLDWFAYHSGTWCGRTVPKSAMGRFLRVYFPGYLGLADVVRVRVRGERMSVSGPTDGQISRVVEELDAITRLAKSHESEVWLMLIPSKPTARGNITAEAHAYDRVVASIGAAFSGVIDLRPIFQGYPDPLSLYYRTDGHWNRTGVALASQELCARLIGMTESDESGSD